MINNSSKIERIREKEKPSTWEGVFKSKIKPFTSQ
jgi:hypothetical protein